MMNGYHDFRQKLEYSRGACEKNDISLIKRALIGCVDVEKTDRETDKKGIDYFAVLRGGARIAIDAKTREPGARKYWKYGEAEAALETWSVVPDGTQRGKVGWTLSETKDVDYILYTFDKGDWDKFYLFPYQLLRNAFRRNFNEWKDRFCLMRQPNKGYYSEALFVPVSVLCGAVAREMEWATI